MALAIDASSPAATTVSGVSTTPISTASFNPPAGSILVVAFSANTATGVTPGTPTITDNLGVPLTYTPGPWKTRATAPAANGQVAFWTAPVVSGGSMIVSVTTGTASGNQQTSLKVWVVTGQDATTPVGTTGKNASLSASSISQSYTGAGTGGWAFLAVCDWTALGSFTAGSGCTVDATGTVPTTQFSYAFARRTVADDTNGGSNSLNVSAAGSSTDLSWAWVEILPPASPATFVPVTPGRRRLLAPPRAWRRRTASPVPAQIIVTPPVFVPLMVRARRTILGLRRSRTAHPVGSRMPAHQQALRPRTKLPKLARSRITNPVPAQIVVTPPVYPPKAWRARVKAVRQTRARVAVVVPPQVAVVAAAFVPQPTKLRARIVRLFRGRFATPVHAQPAPPPTRPRPRPVLRQVTVRRSRVAVPPAIQVAPPSLATRVRAKVVRLARARARFVVPAQITVVPPTYPLAPSRVRRTLFKARMRRGVADGWLVVDCHIPRPGSGVISRPTGVTTRPTGSTARPGTGLTIRPSSGDTPNPC